jgi:hypothetical protein
LKIKEKPRAFVKNLQRMDEKEKIETDPYKRKNNYTNKGQRIFSLLFLTENWVAQIGRGLVFSADLCYNDTGDVNG